MLRCSGALGGLWQVTIYLQKCVFIVIGRLAGARNGHVAGKR